MRIWLPILLVAACTNNSPSKQDASRLFVATTSAVEAAQQKAVTATQANLVAPAVRNLDYIGPCESEGSFEVKGTYDDASGSGAAAAFDLQANFNNCVSSTRTALDGALHWSSTNDANGFTASLTGSMDFSDQTTSASCDLDLHMAVSSSSISYTGSVCGYDVKTDLGL